MRVAFNSPARNQFYSGESFNGRTAGLQPANEGSIPSSSTSLPGRPLRSRRRFEKPEKRVRLVPLAPSVTVAEWLRRQTVDLSTRVQFPPVTPFVRARLTVSRGSLKPAFEVRLLGPQPQGRSSFGGASGSDPEGCWTVASRPCQVPWPLRPIGKGARPRTVK